jgi:hypothetical protein
VVRPDGCFTEMKSRTWLFCLIYALRRKRGEPSFDPLSTLVFPKYQSRLTTKPTTKPRKPRRSANL